MDTIATATASADTAWVHFATHVFDSVWAVVGTTLGGVLAGWLLMKRPAIMDRVLNRGKAVVAPEDDKLP
jgi:hypothetical protein